MKRLLHLVERVAPARVPVLVVGETGSGKDVIARALHEASGLRGPLVALNCAALPTTLAESELFGHVRGAFTGADRDRPGVFQQAAGGTLFLDEIGDMDLPLQAKLLRALDAGTVRPLGATREVAVDARVIAATHRNLPAAIEQGRFREDLYYRLAAIQLRVPALRERTDDVEPLVRRFLAEACAGRQLPSISADAVTWLLRQHWRGNVRELRQAVLRAALLGGDDLVVDDFAPLDTMVCASELAVAYQSSGGRRWSEVERDLLATAIAEHGGVRAAARALGIARSTAYDKARRFGIAVSRGPSSERRGEATREAGHA